MQRLDRYVSSYFISSYGICLLFFLGMFVLIDLFGKSEEILENASKLSGMGFSVSELMLQYYGLMLPFIFLQVAPFVTVMAAMFALTRLRRTNELVPMIVAGRSIFRVVAPIFVFAFLLAVLMGLVQQYVAPGLADSRERVKELLFEGRTERLIDGRFRCGENRYVFVRDYDANRRVIGSFDVSVLDSEEPPTLGADAVWDDAERRFVYSVEVEDGEGGTVVERRTLPESLTPQLVESQERGPYDLSYSQAEFLFGRTGQAKWKVLLHYHLTFPLSNVLLLLLGLPFVLNQHSRSLLLGMVISILICAAYFAFDAVMRNLGDKDVLHPVLAAWFGVIFFGSLGVVLIDGVRS
ncbi:MAG: LptF/LptG family permease [Planctomycetota bacterium JB042]